MVKGQKKKPSSPWAVGTRVRFQVESAVPPTAQVHREKEVKETQKPKVNILFLILVETEYWNIFDQNCWEWFVFCWERYVLMEYTVFYGIPLF